MESSLVGSVAAVLIVTLAVVWSPASAQPETFDCLGATGFNLFCPTGITESMLSCLPLVNGSAYNTICDGIAQCAFAEDEGSNSGNFPVLLNLGLTPDVLCTFINQHTVGMRFDIHVASWHARLSLSACSYTRGSCRLDYIGTFTMCCYCIFFLSLI